MGKFNTVDRTTSSERSFQARTQSALSSRLSVLVPCYNELATVQTVLQQVRAALPFAELIVIDDGSTDGTTELLDDIRQTLDFESIRLARNAGKGAAVRAGLNRATREYTIIQDGDLEYLPTDIVCLLDVAIRQQRPAVYGSRYLNSKRPSRVARMNFMAVRLLAGVLRLRYGVWLTDPATCYKLVRTDTLRNMQLTSSGFELCQEITAKLLSQNRSAIVEVPISYQPRSIAAGKKIRWYDFFPSLARAIATKLIGGSKTNSPN